MKKSFYKAVLLSASLILGTIAFADTVTSSVSALQPSSTAQGLSGVQLAQAAAQGVDSPTLTTSAAIVASTQSASSSSVDSHNSAASSGADVFGSTPNGRTAFTTMVRNLMPLSPQQIVTLRDMFNQTQQAVTQYPGVPPKPTSSSILVNMSPGSTPPVIRLRAGYVTSLVFLDSTGQPWPVVGFDLGNPHAFNIQPTVPDGKSDTLLVQASMTYQEGNLAVMLKDENTPVMLTLIPGQRAVDYRVDLRVPGLGPNAVIGVAGLPQTENPMLLSFMDGVAPEGATLLDVEGAPAQAWSYQDHLFLRTRVTILSPGWISSMNSPDGTHVYELAKTPVVLASQRGEMIQLSIKGL